MYYKKQFKLVDNYYGKARVRLVKVIREPEKHILKELTVNVRLEGNFTVAYTSSNNHIVLPTDTIKNTIYVFAKTHPLNSIEQFGLDVSQHFETRLPHVNKVAVELEETLWQRLTVSGESHPHAFIGGNSEKRTSIVTRSANGTQVQSGIKDLFILKTTGSGFSGFIRDEYTTLKETDDRILSTIITAIWDYKSDDVDFLTCSQSIRHTLISTFAKHYSHSLQQTLYTMAEAVLAECPALAEIHLSMPNKHNLLVDLTSFGLQNNNEIFRPTDEPYGVIEGRVRPSNRANPS